MATGNQTGVVPTPVAQGGTGVTSVTTAPAATSFAGWDSNKNFSAQRYLPAATSTTSGSTVTLTASSAEIQFINNSGVTVTLPNATTLTVGQRWTMIADVAIGLTVQTATGSNLVILPAAGLFAQSVECTCIYTNADTVNSWLIACPNPYAALFPYNNAANRVLTTTSTGNVFTTVNMGVANTFLIGNASGNLVASGFCAGANVNCLSTSTATGGSTTTLSATSSNRRQIFTGSSTQTVKLPAPSSPNTPIGWRYEIVNESTGAITIQSSGSNTICVLTQNQYAILTVLATSGTGANAWDCSIGTISTTAALVNTIAQTPSVTGSGPTIAAVGTDANVPLNLKAQGTGSINLVDGNGNTLLNTVTTASAVNYLQITNAATGQSPTLTATGSDSNIGLIINGKGNSGLQLQGTTAAGNATAGYVGEVITSNIASGSAASITTTNTPQDITSINLTAGDWNVEGNVTFIGGPGDLASNAVGWISTTSATLPDASNYNALILGTLASQSATASCPLLRVNVTTTTTVYLSAQATFASGTRPTACGTILARRVR